MTSRWLQFAACVTVGSGLLGISPRSARADILIPAVAATGTGAFNNDPSLIIDGNLPLRSSFYAASSNVFWADKATQFTVDLGAVYTISSLTAALDNNDDYAVQYSADNVTYKNLFTFLASDGPVTVGQGGMDILTTDSSYPSSVPYPGDSTTPEYVGRGFTPIAARYLRVFAADGDSYYSIGEIQAFRPAAVPEPASVLLLGTGVLGLAGCIRRRRRKATNHA